MEIILQFVLMALGFCLLGKGADWFVEGAAGIAARFGISQLIIGLTVVAMGTSAPEAAVSITAAFNGSADITVGNVIGSNIMNVLVILGCTAAISVLPVARSTVRIELPFVIAISVLLLYLGADGVISFLDGVCLVICFIAYILYLYFEAKKQRADEDMDDAGEAKSLGKSILFTAVGLGVVMLGSRLTVDAATAIALYAGLSERFVGLTIVALGTSLPELFTSVTAARKGNTDIAIGNIVGSNIFNILFVVGLSALVIDIPFAAAFKFDGYVALGAVLLLWLCTAIRHKLTVPAGVLMLALYAGYVYYIF